MTRLLYDHMTYRTGDLALAAALALFCPLEAVDRSDPYTVQFLFRRSRILVEIVAQYHCGTFLVEPQAYCQQVRALDRQLRPPAA